MPLRIPAFAISVGTPTAGPSTSLGMTGRGGGFGGGGEVGESDGLGGGKRRFLDFARNDRFGGTDRRFLDLAGSDRFGGGGLCIELAASAKLVEEAADEAVGTGCVGVGEFGAGGDGAVGGVGDGLFDQASLLCRDGRGFGEVERGDLEAVEEEAGAAGVDGVGGDAAEDLADGDLDGSAVLGKGEVEGGLAGAAVARVADGLAGVVVEVAELFPAEGGAAAAAAFGVDVAALEALGRVFGDAGCVLDDVGHVAGPPPPGFGCKIFKRKDLSSYLEAQASKQESPAGAGLFCVCFQFTWG